MVCVSGRVNVIKGKKMPCHMGDTRRTVQNLKVVKVIADKNLILIKGSVPGSKGSLVTVRTAVKQKRNTSLINKELRI